MYVTQHAVLWSKTSDSHETIAREHGLIEQSAEVVVSRRLAAVPVEVYPDDDDYSRPIGEWAMHLDDTVRNELLPEWWDEADARVRCATALAAWAEYHIIESGKREASGEISLVVRGTATLNATGQTGGYCRAYDSATLNATGQTGGVCWAYCTATLNATGQTGGNCSAYDSATLNRIKAAKTGEI
jgi:hypothetical protein